MKTQLFATEYQMTTYMSLDCRDSHSSLMTAASH